MNDIQKIEIRINRLINSIEMLIDTDNLKCYIKNMEKDFYIEDIKKIINIICLWPHDDYGRKIIDGETYNIRVYTSNGIDTYTGSGSKPIGYDELLDILGGYYE